LAHSENLDGFLVVSLGCAAGAGVAAWLVRWYSPQAAGSSIPHVEAVLNGELPQAPFLIIPAKFIGGVSAIDSGLALGREGPSVQMAGTIGHLVGKEFRRNWPDCRVLLATAAELRSVAKDHAGDGNRGRGCTQRRYCNAKLKPPDQFLEYKYGARACTPRLPSRRAYIRSQFREATHFSTPSDI
jgi:hypothetical protein